MKQRLYCMFLFAAFATLADAHFVFVVPKPDGSSAQVFISEDLNPSKEVDVGIIGGTKLSLREPGGQETPLNLVKDGSVYDAALPGGGLRVVHGVTDLGWMRRGQGKSYVLIYYPKTILGDALSSPQIVGGRTPVEIVPLGKPGAVRLELLEHGKPAPNAELTVILPDGTQRKINTDQTGQTEALSQTGRYGVWARDWEATPGERDGKKYDEVRNYATLVFDVTTMQNVPATEGLTSRRFGTMPEAAASFGAVVDDGWLYLYGGHIAVTHSYSTKSSSGQFHRLRLSDGTWQQLAGGPAMQGVNLAVYDGKIYRAGGMEALNKPDEKQDLHSVADCARFDPATGKWEALPPLPEPRSSHDVVVLNGKLIIVGGWTLDGSSAKAKWIDSMAVLDLKAVHPEWRHVAQPFRRRAIIATAFEGKMYVIGGLNDQGKIVHDVSIYDPKTGAWSEGPELPGAQLNGFSPAACVHAGALYVSVADGTLYRLSPGGEQWEKAGTTTPRVAHRMVSDGDAVLILGGASHGKDFDLIESVPLAKELSRR